MITELIGWIAAAVLFATIARQVFTQWRTRSAVGVSRWLFIGQFSASLLFVVYSVLLQNWVFAATNAVMLCTAAVGQWIALRNRRRADERDADVERALSGALHAESAYRALRTPSANRARREDRPPTLRA